MATDEASINLARAKLRTGEFARAEELYRELIQKYPREANLRNELGYALCMAGRHRDAVQEFQQSLVLRPDFFPAMANMGNALRAIGKFESAVNTYKQALALAGEDAVLLRNLGAVLQEAHRTRESVEYYQRALAIKPDYADAQYELGSALAKLQRWDEAIAACEKAVAMRPTHAMSHNDLGLALQGKEHYDAAIASFQQAIKLAPGSPKAYVNLGRTFGLIGEPEKAVQAFQNGIRVDPAFLLGQSSLAYEVNFNPTYDSAMVLEAARQYALAIETPLKGTVVTHANDRSPDRPLRIGYVSGELYRHVVGQNFLPILEHRDRAQFSVFFYASNSRSDDLTQRMREAADGWREIAGVDDEAAAQQIRDDKIDILIDASLHMAHNRLPLFARKPAPVQVTWLGYPGTTGLSAIDYRLTDPYLDPLGQDDAVYSEQSFRLPETFWCYDPIGEEPVIGELPCVENKFVTFGCFNNYCKVNDQVIALWADVLKGNPGSRLICLAPEGNCRQRFRERLAALGVDAGRAEFASRRNRPAYLRLYGEIDIGLDTFPYNGHTTSLDSYWMGVPVITLVGRTVVGRAGVSQLNNLGLTELIAHTPEQFVRIARELAGDQARLGELRRTLRERMRNSPLMDGARFVRGVEAACRTMWRKWTAG